MIGAPGASNQNEKSNGDKHAGPLAAAARVAYPIHLVMPIANAATVSLINGRQNQVHGLMLTGHSTITKSPAKSAALHKQFSELAENLAFLLWPVAVTIQPKQTTSQIHENKNHGVNHHRISHWSNSFWIPQ